MEEHALLHGTESVERLPSRHDHARAPRIPSAPGKAGELASTASETAERMTDRAQELASEAVDTVRERLTDDGGQPQQQTH